MSEFNLDAYLTNKYGSSITEGDKLGDLGRAANKKVADLQSVVDGTSGNQVAQQAEDLANKDSWTSKLGLNPDGIPGEAVNMAATLADGTAKVGTQIINMVPTLKAAAEMQGVPEEVKLAHARYKNGSQTDEDMKLLSLPDGDISENRPLSKYQAVARAEARKTGRLQTNMERMAKVDEALKFGEDLRSQTDISSIVHKGNQTDITNTAKAGYKDGMAKITSGWDKGGATGAMDVASGIAGLIGTVGEAAWKNPTAAMELVVSNTPQLAAAALSGGAMTTTNVAYAMEAYSKGVQEYQKTHNGQIPSGDELATMAAKAGSLAVAETLGDKFMLGAKVIPGSGKVAGAVEKTAIGRAGAAVGEGAVGEFGTEFYQTGMERNIEGKPYSGEENYVGGTLGAVAGGGLSAGVHLASPSHVPGTSPAADAPAPVPQAVQETYTAAKETGDVSALTDPQSPAYAPDKAVQALMTHSRENGTPDVQEKNIREAFDIMAKFNGDYVAKSDAYDALEDKTTPEAKAMAKELSGTKKSVEKAQRVMDRFQTDYFTAMDVQDQLAKLEAKAAPEDGGEASVAPEAAQAAENIINLSMVSPKRVTEDDANTLINSPATTETQKDYLRKFAATRVAENELRGLGDVSKEIVDGSKTNLGLTQYREQVASAIGAGSIKKANASLDLLTNFETSHSQKATLTAEAFQDYQDTGKPVQVVKNDATKQWEIRYSNFLEGKEAKINGAVTVNAASQKLVSSIQKEADAIAATKAELAAAIDLRFNGAKNVQNLPSAQAVSSGNSSVGAVQPAPASATSGQAAPTVPAQPVAVSPSPVGVSPSAVSTAAQPAVTTQLTQAASGSSTENPLKSTQETEKTKNPLHSTEGTESTASISPMVPEAPLSTKNSTESDSQSKPGLTVLQQGQDKANTLPPGERGAVYRKINRAATFLKQKGAKVEKDEDIGRDKPLVAVNNLLTLMNDGTVEPDSLFPGGLTDEQRTAITTFQKFATKWSADIKALLIKGSIKNSQGNQVNPEFVYEDPLQDFFNADGTMDENVVTAIAYGAYSWINDTIHAPMSKDAADLLEMHGLDGEANTMTKAGVAILRNVAAMETAVINDLGDRIVKALGLSATPDAPLDYLPGLATAFGIHALQVLRKNELVKTETFKGNVLTNFMPEFSMEANKSITYVSLVRDGKELPNDSRAIRDANADTQGVVDKLFDSEKTPTEASWTPIPFKQEFAKRTGQQVSKEQTATLKKAQKVPHRIIPSMWHALSVLGDDVILKAAGWKEANDDKIHAKNRDSVEAQNLNLENQLLSLKGLITNALTNSTEKLEQPFFLNYEVWRNFRVGISTRDLNPQTSKIHRFMIYRPEWKATIKTADAEQFLIGVAQAMGVKVDQQRNSKSMDIFNKKVQAKGIDALATKLYDATLSPETASLSTQDKEAIADLAAGNEGMQTLQALVAYGTYLHAKDKGDATFESHMLVGVDGKTNGPILSQLALGAAGSIKALFSRLNRGGMYRAEDGVKNYNLWYENDASLDLYEDLASHVLKGLPNSATMTAIQTFTKELMSGNKVTSAGRKIVKTPLTAFTFGSAVEKSVLSMREAFIQSVYDKIEAVADGSDKSTSRGQLIDSLNQLVGRKNAFSADTTIEQLMVLDLDAKENKARLDSMNDAFDNTMGAAVTETMNNYFKVFSSRRSAVNKAIQTSFEIYDALYRDLEAKEMTRLMEAGEIDYRDVKRKDGTTDRVPVHGMNATQKAALDAKVAHVLPQAHTAYSQAEGDLNAGLYMAKTSNGRSTQPYGYAKTQFATPVLNAEGKPVTAMKASSMERREVGPGAAGLPYFMHSSDSAIMHRALAQFIEAMNVHDEIGNGADKVRETAKAINGATWKTLLTFSPATEAFQMLERSVTNVLQMAEDGDVSPAVLKQIQASFEALLYQDEEVAPADLPVHILSRLRGQQFKANKVRLEAMAEMTAIDQYTWEDGQYDVTEADRAEARKLLAELEAEGAPLTEAMEASADALGKLFVKGVQPATAKQVAPVITAEQTQTTPATAAWAVGQVAAELDTKEARDLQKAVEAGQNVAEAINAMPEGADKDAVVESLVQAADSLNQGVFTPFGQLGSPVVESNAELVSYLQANPNPQVKDLIKQLVGMLRKDGGWSSKLQADMLRVLYKLAPADLTVRYITPETKAGDVLAMPTEASRGWYVAKGSKQEVNLLSPDFVDSGLTPELVIHELIHSVLARAVINPTGDAKALVSELEEILSVARGYVEDKGLTKFDGAVTEVNELLAWGLTNRDFQTEVLSKIQLDESRTTKNRLVAGMQKFINTISKYLFKSPTDMQTNGLGMLIANASGLFKHAAEQKQGPQSQVATVLSMAVQRITEYSTQDVFNALEDGRLSDADKSRITGLLTGIVEKLHGKFGSLRQAIMNSQAGTPLDAFITAEAEGAVPFASATIASPFRVSSQLAFALEQVEVTIKTALDSHDAAAKSAYAQLGKLYTEAKTLLQGKLPQDQHDFLFTPTKDNGNQSDYLARFAAMALVHPEVNELMKVSTDTGTMASGGSFADKLQRFFEKMLELLTDKITGTYAGQRADAKLEQLVKQLVSIEAKSKQVLARNAVTTAMLEPVEDMAKSLAEKGRAAVSKAAGSKLFTGSKNQFIRTAGVVAKIYADDRVEDFLDGMKTIRNKEFKSSEGVMASLVTEVRGHLVVFQEILREAKIREGERKDIITQGAAAVLAGFKDSEKLTEAQKTGVTRIFMRSGAHHLLDHFDLKQIEAMLADPAVLDKHIGEMEAKLGNYRGLKDAVIEQAQVLGYYKATGYVRGLLHANGHNISRLLGTKYEGNVDHIQAYRSEATINALVTLYSIGYSSDADKAAANSVLSAENGRGTENGVEFMLKLHKHMEAESLEKLFKGNPTLMMHGYTPEVYNPNTDIQVVNNELGDLLVAQGYSKGPRVNPDNLDPNGGVKHIYVQKDGGLSRRVTGAFSLSDTGAKGSRLEIENPNEFSTMAMSAWDRQTKGSSWKLMSNRSDNHAAPIFNEAGRITDWRYLMAESTKDSILERDNRFEHLMGKMAGSVYDKQATPVQNKKAVEVLREEYNKSFADNPDDFIKIGAGSADASLREIWNLLPAQTQADIRKVWGQDAMMVRKDSLNILFGYRKLSMADAFNKEDKGFMDKAMIQLTTQIFGAKAEHRVRQFERRWLAVVSEIKDIVVVKTGTVMIGNIKSNMWLLALSGVPFRQNLNSHLVALRGATAYRKDSEKLARLQLARSADYIKGSVKELDDEITRLEDSIARNPVKELIDAGLMPTIVEDVAAADDIYSYRSKFARDVDEKMDQYLHPVIQRGLKNVYMTHDTKLYQGLSRVTQLSDFVARYALYQHLTTRKKNPLSKKEAIQQASEAFVNYDIPMHPLLQYVDDMGIIPFMKYFLRIQKVLIRLVRENPARVLGTIILDNIWELGETVLDSSALRKVGNNPLTTGAFRYFSTLDQLATVNGAMSVFK
jgi:hypothetical protein